MWAQLVSAQNVTITASVDRQEVAVNENVTYQVRVSGSSQRRPDISIPNLEQHFAVLSQSRQNSITIINGVTNVSQIFKFTLRPKQVGDVVINPAEYVENGQTYRSREVRVRVTEAKTQPAPASQTPSRPQRDSQIFAFSSLSEPSVYVGQEVVYELSLFRRIRLWSNITYEIPKFEGFWADDLDVNQEQYIKRVDNQNYYVQELVRKSLFPLKAGSFTIPESRVSFVIHPFDGEKVVASEPKSVRVKPLPKAGKPSPFSGLVGDVDLRLETELPAVITQNIPLNVSFALVGSGGITRVSDLHFQDTDDFKIYRSKITDDISKRRGTSGTRRFEYVIVPKMPGMVQIPTFSISSFSPTQEAYRVSEVPAHTLRVLSSGMQDMSYSDKGLMVSVSQDLRYLHTPFSPEKQKDYFWNISWMLLGLLPLCGILAEALLAAKRRFFQSSLDDVKFSKSYSVAFKAISDLSSQPGNSKFYSELQGIILTFLSDRSRQSMQGLTQAERAAELRDLGMPLEIIEDINQVLESLSSAAYAGGSTSTSKTALTDDVVALLKRIKKEAKDF
jgi:hypothetical protein